MKLFHEPWGGRACTARGRSKNFRILLAEPGSNIFELDFRILVVGAAEIEKAFHLDMEWNFPGPENAPLKGEGGNGNEKDPFDLGGDLGSHFDLWDS
jgi:hypothetical protein